MTRWFLLGCAATVLSGCWGFFIKIALSDGADFYAITAISSLTVLAAPLILWWRRRSEISPAGSTVPNVSLALLSGLLGGAGQIGYFGALSLGPASVVAPLSGLYPVVTIILSVVLLKEHPGKIEMIGIALALAAPILMLL